MIGAQHLGGNGADEDALKLIKHAEQLTQETVSRYVKKHSDAVIEPLLTAQRH